jgi:hypothetical protein
MPVVEMSLQDLVKHVRGEISRNNTRVYLDQDGDLCVMLHNTVVASYQPDDGVVKLYTGGWRTVTTKARINAALRALGLWDAGVFQKAHKWYLQEGQEIRPFEEGIAVTAT